MAFNFLGTFKKRDLEGLATFTQAEIDKIPQMISHLALERDRLRKTLSQIIDSARQNGIDVTIWANTFRNYEFTTFFDQDSAVLIQRIKEPFVLNIKNRDDIEHKIYKIFDRMEQIEQRIALLRFAINEFSKNVEQARSLFNDKHPYLVNEG